MTERSNRPSRGRSRGGPSSGRNRGARPTKKSGPSGPPPEELKPILEPPDIESFTEWELGDEIQGCLAEMGITEPTPVQKLAIGSVLEGRDVIAKAETGTGKTLAFGAPMMAKVEAGRSTVLGLVLAPTRELAQQVAQVLEKLGEARGIGVALVVGGDPMQPQIKKLQSGVQVVVGTPGRVLDLMKQRFLKFPWLEFAVLDEADEMLEIGFLPDVEKILEGTAEERQTLLFSATFPPALLALARKHTRNPVELATAKGVSTVDRITQRVVFLGDEDRPHVLKRLLMDSSPDELFLVFCDRRTEVDRLMRRLERLPVGIKALHGGYDQAARFRVMSAFRQGQVRALIATDVASRGLDVTGVTHVINYSPPRDISDYTHRIGRTGRAGRTGCAVTFVAGPDGRRWKDLERQMNWEVPEVGERDLSHEVLPNAKGRGRGGSHRDRSENESSPRRDREPRGEREPRQERARREEHEPRRERTAREDREPRRERTPHRERTPREDRSDAHRGEFQRERSREESRPRRSSRDADRRPTNEEVEAPRREPRRRSSGRDEESRIVRSRSRSEPDRSEAPRRSVPRDESTDRDNLEERPRRKVRTRSSGRNGSEPREESQAPRRDENEPTRRRRRRQAEPEAPREREPRSRREPEDQAHRQRTRTRSRSAEDPRDSRAERDSESRDREASPRRSRSSRDERPRESEPREDRPRREPRERSSGRDREREPRGDRDEERPRRRRRSSPERSAERDEQPRREEHRREEPSREEPRRERSRRDAPRRAERSSREERPRERSRPEEPAPREDRPRRRRRSAGDESRGEPRRDSNPGNSGPKGRKRRGPQDSSSPPEDDGFGAGV